MQYVKKTFLRGYKHSPERYTIITVFIKYQIFEFDDGESLLQQNYFFYNSSTFKVKSKIIIIFLYSLTIEHFNLKISFTEKNNVEIHSL